MRRNSKKLLLIFLCAVLVTALVLYLSLHEDTTPTASATGVRINEVMTSNKGSVPDENGNYPDWVELYNGSNADADISGYGLSDDLLEGAKYVFPAGTVIPAGGYHMVFCSGEADAAGTHAAFKLSAKDELVFFDATGVTLQSIQLRAVSAGNALCLGSDGTTWNEMKPSPGYENTEAGIAQYEASLSAGEDMGVTINEFMASNATVVTDQYGVASDWIELYNANDQDVDLSGYGISDNISQPVKYRLPEGTVIPAHGCLLIFCSGNETKEGEAELHAPFGLRAYEEDVVFSDKRGMIIDSFSYTRQETDVSMARIPDGTGEFAPCAQPTPGYPNTDEGYQSFMAQAAAHGDLYLSEMMGQNDDEAPLEEQYYDWVELHNAGTQAVNLSGYGISDNPKNPAKWTFPEVAIEPGEYLVVYANGQNVSDPQKKNRLQLNFKISAEGESVFLFDPEGKLVDKLSAGRFMAGVSYGRTDARFLYYTQPSPGAANGTGAEGITAQPVFLTTPGIYDGPVTVELSGASGETLYYTTDCTTPTAGSTPYTGPITVDKNTVVRAVSIRDGYLTGYSASGTYLFTTDGVNHALDVVCLVTDPDNLWNEQNGIYAYGTDFDPDESYPRTSGNYWEKGDEWERPASFELFKEGRQDFVQNVSIRIAGAYSRGNAQKAFNIAAREEYGAGRMAYSFFDNREYTQYKSLQLRAGGQDQRMSKLRDELSLGLLEGSDVNILHQAYRPCVLYLNGEYWGMYFLKEKRNRFFVAQHEGLENNDDMTLIKGKATVTHGDDIGEWNEIMNYVRSHDLSGADAYNHVAALVDTDSFMDYMICEIYSANSDYGNIQWYKAGSGKWKWIFYDFCWSWGSSSPSIEHPTLANRRLSKNHGSDLFNALLKNQAWRDKFIKRFAVLMKTVYEPTRVNALIDELAGYIQPELVREREKFNGATFMGVKNAPEGQATASIESWQKNVQKVRDFANQRPAAVRAQIQSEFGLSDSYMKEVFG